MTRLFSKQNLSATLLALSVPVAAFAVAAMPGESAAAPTVGMPSPFAVASSKAEGEGWTAQVKITPAQVKKQSSFDVVMTTKSGYHVNQSYPFKFKLNDAPAGVTFPKPLLQRADGTFDEHKATFSVPFVADKPGKYTMSGTLMLGVCTDQNCLMDKAPLEVTVEVK